MTQTKKVIIGVFTFAPVLLFIWYIISMFSFAFGMNEMVTEHNGVAKDPSIFFRGMFGMMLPLLLFFANSIGLLIYYLIDIFSLNPKFKQDTNNSRLIWTLVILFGGFIGMIVYYFVEIITRKPIDPNLAHKIQEIIP